ncbi:4'-phosphopantetheinyl transferase family protein [Vibrio mangrovi]|uniref:4'-phosphopantetheinyl transferase superfamily protein n=1 Tax=Vibrio mangrovi TaxID=474394 RepID=A0A1Y6INF6_9VIBR|nr:4'-phosphopantetheinyl transferase superfamily protein [Vibrio mangrovi]MDW6004026.1 4'-phosphopantetheinyl transferase superfamily protein [Vibrio mangrovi]SMR99176.1 hypothetical protein VIM7927_00399 [Vibrio mangrovi]
MATSSKIVSHDGITETQLSAGTDVPRFVITRADLSPRVSMTENRAQVREQAHRQTQKWLTRVWNSVSRSTNAPKTKCTEFRIQYTQQGQPYGIHPTLGQCALSLSHSDVWYAIATAPQQTLGIDLQCYRHFGPSALQLAFTAEEHGQSMALLCAVWAVREAFLKSHGKGLPYSLRTIQVDWQRRLVSDTTTGLSERMFWIFYGLYWVCAICYHPGSRAPVLMPDNLRTSVLCTDLSGRRK